MSILQHTPSFLSIDMRRIASGQDLAITMEDNTFTPTHYLTTPIMSFDFTFLKQDFTQSAFDIEPNAYQTLPTTTKDMFKEDSFDLSVLLDTPQISPYSTAYNSWKGRHRKRSYTETGAKILTMPAVKKSKLCIQATVSEGPSTEKTASAEKSSAKQASLVDIIDTTLETKKAEDSESDYQGEGSDAESDYEQVNISKQVAKVKPVRKAHEKFNLSRWTEEEEIMLQGVVIDCNLRFGTQASWKQICKCYTLATQTFADLHKLPPFQQRSACALKKHYRMMHTKMREGDVDNDFWYNVYHQRWLSEDFNAGRKLIDYNFS